MTLELKLARRSVVRGVKTYGVYLVTLAIAAMLLYSFCAAGSYLTALDLTPLQRSMVDSDIFATVLQAFSGLVVVVFAVVMTNANRFLIRRRSQEFALYRLLGMSRARLGLIVIAERVLVDLGALVVGVLLGVLASLLLGLASSYIFGATWHLALFVDVGSLVWTAACFAAISFVSSITSVFDVTARSLVDLVHARSIPEAQRPARLGPVLSMLAGLAMLSCVWGVCILVPDGFFILIVPIGIAGYLGTLLVLRSLARALPALLRSIRIVWLSRLTCFVTRQIESRVITTGRTLSSVTVLMSLGVCLVAGGCAFVAAVHGNVVLSDNGTDGLAFIAFVTLFYGIVFLVSAAAVLGLQQVAQTTDSLGDYRLLGRIGASDRALAGAVRGQVGAYFGVPCAMSAVHCVAGLSFTNYVTQAYGVGSWVDVPAVVGIVGVVMGAYLLVTCLQCTRIAVQASTEVAAAV